MNSNVYFLEVNENWNLFINQHRLICSVEKCKKKLYKKKKAFCILYFHEFFSRRKRRIDSTQWCIRYFYDIWCIFHFHEIFWKKVRRLYAISTFTKALCSRFFQNRKIRFKNCKNSYVPKFIILHNGGFKMLGFH